MLVSRLIFKFVKVVTYAVLAIMLYSNFIGPDKIAELLKIENPSEKGLEEMALLIPKHVLMWTLWTVILEVIDNTVSFFQFMKTKNKYLTREEYRVEQSNRLLEKHEMGLRIAKLEGKFKKSK